MTHPLLDAKFDQLDHNPVVDECLASQKAKQVTENNSEKTHHQRKNGLLCNKATVQKEEKSAV